VTGWEQVEKQVVEATTHMGATGRCVREPNLFPYKYPTFSTPVILHTYSPMKMEQGVLTTLAFKLQKPVNNPEESIQHSDHDGSLKSTTIF
jgi:hypothetical protein